MNAAERFARIREALVALRDASPGERSALFDALDAEDPTLRPEVESLLVHVDTPADILGAHAPAARLGLVLDGGAGIGTGVGVGSMLGPYRLFEELGAGGMGVVHRAEQTSPIVREVAIKLVKRGLDSRRVVQRFEHERQVLARLEHPHIARVLDAGADPHGRPYFVMELVRGEPITTACDRLALSLAARLDLFLLVCDATGHAHRRGIIHRDLKPSNVLVSERDGALVPKIIDFGIAKLTSDPSDDGAALTLADQVLGTPDYMSPEQAGAFGGAVDTRTDVYALGVILYELLTGTRPFRLTSQDLPALRQILVETAPERPSARAPDHDRDRLEGDLDVIVLHALAKDPERRYGSVAELAADVRRHLGGLPILARPPTIGYRLGKLVRRHKVAFVVGLAALVALVAFVAALIVQADALATETTRARAAEARAELEAAKARGEAASADAVATFLSELFVGVDPTRARGATLTARELVDRGADRLAHDVQGGADPRVRARLLHVLGSVYHNLGAFDRAAGALDEALTARVASLGLLHPLTIDTLALAGVVAHDRGDDALAVARARHALALSTLVNGADHPVTAASLKDLAVALESIGDVATAEVHYRDAVLHYRRALGDDAPGLAWAMNKLGQAHLAHAEPTVARALFERALAIQYAALGPDHPDVGSSLNNLAGALADEGRLEEALATFRETLALFERLHGDAHPDVGRSHANVASVLRRLGDPVGAFDHLSIDLAMTRRLLGPEHIHVGRSLAGLGMALLDLGDLAGAEDFLDEALALRLARLDPDHRVVATNRLALARLYTRTRRWAEAEHALTLAQASLARTLDPDHPALTEVGDVRRELELARRDPP